MSFPGRHLARSPSRLNEHLAVAAVIAIRPARGTSNLPRVSCLSVATNVVLGRPGHQRGNDSMRRQASHSGAMSAHSPGHYGECGGPSVPGGCSSKKKPRGFPRALIPFQDLDRLRRRGCAAHRHGDRPVSVVGPNMFDRCRSPAGSARNRRADQPSLIARIADPCTAADRNLPGCASGRHNLRRDWVGPVLGLLTLTVARDHWCRLWDRLRLGPGAPGAPAGPARLAVPADPQGPSVPTSPCSPCAPEGPSHQRRLAVPAHPQGPSHQCRLAVPANPQGPSHQRRLAVPADP